jgi:ABC-type multidrug transport system permease subunit
MPTSTSTSTTPNALLELTKGRCREFIREPSAFFFVILMPVVWMVILGFAFSRSRPEVYGVGWPDAGATARPPVAAKVLETLRASEHVHLVTGDDAQLLLAQKRGDVQLVLRFLDGQPSYEYDPTNPQALQARRLVDDLVQTAAGRTDPLAGRDQQVAVPGMRYVDFLVPGLVALSIMTSSLFGTAITIVANRRDNLLKRYLATPMRPMDYLLSHIFGRGFILAVELTAILVAALVLFRFRIEGGLIPFVAFAALGAASFTALAILCGARSSNPASVNGITNLISLPMMIVSGVWFSRVNFPDWMASAARVLPLTALVDGLRRIALEGAPLSSLGFEIGVLVAYLVGGALAARALFKWY